MHASMVPDLSEAVGGANPLFLTCLAMAVTRANLFHHSVLARVISFSNKF